jgi:class 3 adenylate cyclase
MSDTPKIPELEARLANHAPEDMSAARIDLSVELAWELGMSDAPRLRALSLAALADATASGHSRGRAGALRNLGYVRMFEGDNEAAIAAILEARTIFEALGDTRGLLTTIDLLANLHLRVGALDSSLVHAMRARELSEALGDTRGLGWAHHNLANVHSRLGDRVEAERQLHAAAACFTACGHTGGLGRIFGLLADLLEARGEYAAAEQQRRAALEHLTASGHVAGIGFGRLALARACVRRGALDEARACLVASAEVGQAIVDPAFHAELRLAGCRLEVAAGASEAAEAALTVLLPTLEALRDRGPELQALDLLADLREGRGDSAGALAVLRRRMARGEASHDDEVQVRARNLQVSMAIAAAEREAQVVEQLLLRTLPPSIVRELRASGRVASMHHEHATVLFTDLVGFTRIAEHLAPAALVAELDALFGAFDEVSRRHGLEKLKTIGDAYMAAAGVPEPRGTHALDAVLAALEIRELMRGWVRASAPAGAPTWAIRIGLSSGPLVAGVIGHDKFAYDVWGDTVNTAARMESSGEPDHINISASTHALVAPFLVCTDRGQVAAKNKGAIAMYFVERLDPAYTDDPAGVRPNDRLRELMAQQRDAG